MKRKLVLIFDSDSEVLNVELRLMFNNSLDAEQYLLSTGRIADVKIDPENEYFSFKTNSWKGYGAAYWVVDKT